MTGENDDFMQTEAEKKFHATDKAIGALIEAHGQLAVWVQRIQGIADDPDLGYFVKDPRYLEIDYDTFLNMWFEVSKKAKEYYDAHGIVAFPEGVEGRADGDHGVAGLSGAALIWGLYGLIALMGTLGTICLRMYTNWKNSEDERRTEIIKIFANLEPEKLEKITDTLTAIGKVASASVGAPAIPGIGAIEIFGFRVNPLNLLIWPLAGFGAYKFYKEGLGDG